MTESSMTPLSENVAVVTGATGRVGEAIALDLAKQGAGVCLIGRKVQELERIQETIRAMDGRVATYCADLTSLPEIDQAARLIQAYWTRVDILVHSAGTLTLGSIEDTPVEVLDRLYHVNLRAPYALTRLFLPELKRRQGQVVFVNSSVSFQGGKANVGAYASTKCALKALADSLREEVNPQGIRVLSVYPGRTASAMQEAVHRIENKTYHPERLLQPEDIAKAVVQALSLPRTAEVTDLSIRPFLKT